MRKLILSLLLCAPAPLLAEGDWWLGVGCEGQGTFGDAPFTACKSSDCNGGAFHATGTCTRTSTRFTKLAFTTYAGGTLHASTRYALHTGDVLITPAVLTSEEKPVFTTQTACPVANATLNWIFVQWDSGTREMTDTYLLGSATYDTVAGITVTGQYDIDGATYFLGKRPMAGSCANGVYPAVDPISLDLNGTVYFTAGGGGVYKTTGGRATLFFPQLTVVLATDLGSKTAQGIAFDSRLAANTRTVRVTTNAGGDQFTVEPYLDPEAGTFDTSFTDVISIGATNTPNNGMLLGTISRNGGTAVKVACIVNRNFDLRVVCSGESPEDPTYPYSVAFIIEAGCPTNYVRVPQNGSVGAASDFCAAKYEMKILGNDNGNQAYSSAFVADVRATGTPWSRASRDHAITECQALGSGYDLATNAQRQAIARSIEDAYASGAYLNWSNGRQDNTPIDNTINQGHSDSTPVGPQAASASDADAYYCTNNDGCTTNTTGTFTQKRTHQLSNGEILWDIAGNLWEWVKDDSSTVWGPDTRLAAELWNPGGRELWGPRGSYAAGGTYPKLVTPYGGIGHGYLNYSAGAILRGAGSGDGGLSGVFATGLYYSPGITNSAVGFRCVYTP